MKVLCLTLLGCCDLVTCYYKHIISVDASYRGRDNPSCLQPGGQPCKTLEYVQSQLNSLARGSVEIEISPPGVNLTKPLNFTGFIDLSITGAGSYATVLCNTSSAGLSFVNVTGLSLNHIQLFACGTENRELVSAFIEVSALQIFNCHDVNITNTHIKRSNGTGISILDTDGSVLIENTTVTESSLKTNVTREVYGGSGVSIRFNLCPLIRGAHHQLPECVINQQQCCSSASYTISGLTSSRNTVTAYRSQDLPCNSVGSGVGTWIELGPCTTNVTIRIYDSLFLDNHGNACGGGMLISPFVSSGNNSVMVVRAVIANNSVGSREVGGGLQIIFPVCPTQKRNHRDLSITAIEIVSCKFENNSAFSGGGVDIYSNELSTRDDVRAVHFTDCSWTGNSASQNGAAIHIMAGVLVSGVRGHYPTIVFTDCSFISNRVLPRVTPGENLSTQVNGGGAFFSSILSVVFAGETTFEGNNASALYLSGSIASFTAGSQVLFRNNSGKNGGAVCLVGQSYLYLNGSSNFSFVNNTASHLGGALFFQSTDSVVYRPCFMYRALNIDLSNLYFESNQACGGRGDHMYVSSFNGCEFLCSNATADVFECIGEFTFSDPQNNTTATLPTDFTLKSAEPVKLFPGLSLRLPLVATDSLGNTVPNVSYRATLANNSSVIWINPLFEYVSSNTVNVVGKPKEKSTLYLDALYTDISLLVEVALEKCPPGYILNRTSGTCMCSASTYYGLLKCDPGAFIRYGVWMGECVNHSTLCTADCPIGYCSYNTTKDTKPLYYELPMQVDRLEEAICSSTRNGTVCGSCKADHSVYYNSWTYYCGKEDKCHLGPLFFLLSVILPMTVLFLLITLLDSNFASDWNSFLLFAQVVHSYPLYGNGAIRLPHSEFKTIGWIMYTYGLFNLDFFKTDETSFCIWKGANVMDIVMVDFGSICFALGLVLFTVCILNKPRTARHFPCLMRRRYSVINGLSAFFILCYSKCLSCCFKVLVYICLYDQNTVCRKSVVLYSGNMEAFRGAHIKYVAVAVVFLLFLVALPPALLLFYPLFFRLLGFCKLSESHLAVTLWRMMPIQLLDSFQNPFKDNCRCFAGLYFLYRVLVLTAQATLLSLVEIHTTVGVIVLVMILLHAAFQPYKSRIRNIVDLLLFFNLALLNVLILYTYVAVATSETGRRRRSTVLAAVQVIALLLPLACVAVFVTAKIIARVRRVWDRVKARRGYSTLQMSHSTQNK